TGSGQGGGGRFWGRGAPQEEPDLTPSDLAEPRPLAEALALIDPADPSVRPIAGGTALMLMMKAAVFRPTRLVSLRHIEKKFSAIAEANGELRIGAMVTLSALEP